MNIFNKIVKMQIGRGTFITARTLLNNETHRLLSTVSSTKVSEITLIMLNRPHKVNAIDLTTLRKLKQEVQNFENDNNSHYAVLYGQGGNFSSGFDLHELSEIGPSIICDEFQEFLKRPAKKPIIAAVNGYAVGQGFDLALWCDIRFVEEDALMGFYNRRFGIPISDVTMRRLVGMVGTSRSMNMVVHGRSITSREAYESGINNKVVGTGTALGEAVDKAIQLKRLKQDGILADRATLLLQIDGSLDKNEWVEEQSTRTKSAYETSKPLIEQFVNEEFGRHGSFKNPKNRDTFLDFLNESCQQSA